MINSMQLAIIKKDVKAIIFNKRLLPVLLIVPFVFTVVIPTVMLVLILYMPETSDDFNEILAIIPGFSTGSNVRLSIITFFINSVIPLFFIIIPIMSASVMAASSFVGEKEKKTLETLLYSPISLVKIFTAKIYASLFLSLFVCFLSFIVMITVLQLELMILRGINLPLDIVTWFIILCLLSPAMSLLAITLTVGGSAKAQTVEESQQRAAFLVLPIILLIVGQFTGLIILSPLLLVAFAIIFIVLAVFLMKRASSKFNYEVLLKQ